eukprot:jgi/Botrbrau1/2019/Bobra.0047s0004.2
MFADACLRVYDTQQVREVRGWPSSGQIHLIRQTDWRLGSSHREIYACILAPSTIPKEVFGSSVIPSQASELAAPPRNFSISIGMFTAAVLFVAVAVVLGGYLFFDVDPRTVIFLVLAMALAYCCLPLFSNDEAGDATPLPEELMGQTQLTEASMLYHDLPMDFAAISKRVYEVEIPERPHAPVAAGHGCHKARLMSIRVRFWGFMAVESHPRVKSCPALQMVN